MSDNNEKELNEEPENGAQRVGQRLQQAREARGLSRSDVSRELRLAEKLIAALEENRSDDLPPSTFVSGYLRSYGRLLGLDAEALVADYRPQTDTPPPLVPKAGRTQVHSGALPVKLVTYFVILGLAVLLVLWWLSRQPQEVSAPAATTLGAGESVDLALPAAPDRTDAVASEVAEEGNEAPAGVESPDEPAAAASEESAPVERAFSEEAATTEIDGPAATLTATISADSWMEVYGRDEEQLAYGLYKAGRTVTLVGHAPFRVFLGFAPGVQLQLNGEAVDVMRHKRVTNDTARFEVGSDDDNLSPR